MRRFSVNEWTSKQWRVWLLSVLVILCLVSGCGVVGSSAAEVVVRDQHTSEVAASSLSDPEASEAEQTVDDVTSDIEHDVGGGENEIDLPGPLVPSEEPLVRGEVVPMPDPTPEEIKALVAQGVTSTPLNLEVASPGHVLHEGNHGIEGLRVVVNSSGGLHPFNITSVPLEGDFAELVSGIATGPALRFSASDPDAVISAMVTMPYSEDEIAVGAEEDLRLIGFGYQGGSSWSPLDGEVVVDAVNNTVTMQVDELATFVVSAGIDVEEGRAAFSTWWMERFVANFSNIKESR